jgi:hypothetical protein
MDRKLRTLVVGILAFALANSLQTSLAETQGECVAKIAGRIAELKLTEPLEAIVKKTREHYLNVMALLKSLSPSEEYLLALEKIGPQKDCDKLLDIFEEITLDGCFGESFISRSILTVRLLLSSQEARKFYYAAAGCMSMLQIRKEERAMCATKVANRLVDKITLSEPIKVFVEEMKNIKSEIYDELKRITPSDACNELTAAVVEEMETLDCYQSNFSGTGEHSRERRYFEWNVEKISQGANDIMTAKLRCAQAAYWIDLVENYDRDQDKSVDESDHDQDKSVDESDHDQNEH